MTQQPTPLQLTYVAPGSMLGAITRENAHVVEAVAEQYAAIAYCRDAAVRDLVWGSLWAASLAFYIRGHWTPAIPMGLTFAALLGLAVYNVIYPSRKGLLTGGSAMIVAGFVSLFTVGPLGFGRASFTCSFGYTGLCAPLGVIAVIVGAVRLVHYLRSPAAQGVIPDQLQAVSQVVRGIMRSSLRRDQAIFKCKNAGTWTYQIWRGRLLDDVAVIVSKGAGAGDRRFQILLAAREEVRVLREPRGIWQQTYLIELRGVQYRLRMDRRSGDRICAWVAGAPTREQTPAIPMAQAVPPSDSSTA